MLKKLSLVFLIVSTSYGLPDARPCLIELGRITKTEPIYMEPNLNFKIPVGNSMIIQSGDSFLIDCGIGRRFVDENVQQYTIACENGALFKRSSVQWTNVNQFSKLQCSTNEQPSPVVRIEKSGICGGDGRLYNIGFKVLNGNVQEFVPVLQSCFDEGSKSVLYVRSNIFGAVDRTGSAEFSINNGRWINENQIPSSFFEVSRVNQAYSSNNFARGHLAPNVDYPFAQHRRATYLYLNMSPMTQRFNGGDWKSLENYVRRLVASYSQTATILTGGFAYNNDQALAKVDRPIDLLNQNEYGDTYTIPGNNVKTIVVPNVFWKIVKIQNYGMAFYMIDGNVQNQAFCQNLCPNRKYVCCNVDDFTTAVNSIKGRFDWPNEFKSRPGNRFNNLNVI